LGFRGEYRYHRALPAYPNLRANALLALDGSLSHVTEVLSGDYYQPLSTSSPHQIWSSAMVISPVLRGLLGLETDAVGNKVVFAPHVPADWTTFAIHHVRSGDAVLDFSYRKTLDEVALDIQSSASSELEFSPALSPRTQILSVQVNGHRSPYLLVQNSDSDQHVVVHTSLTKGKSTLRIRMRNDFGASIASSLPPLGSSSRGLHVISNLWSASRDTSP